MHLINCQLFVGFNAAGDIFKEIISYTYHVKVIQMSYSNPFNDAKLDESFKHYHLRPRS